MDTTQDISKVDQLSQVFRYVTIANDENGTLQSGSIKRWELLETHLSVPKAGQPTLKRLCPTRWASRQDAVQSLRFRYADIMQALTKIDLLSKKSEELPRRLA
ncbi:hypothetical protein F7725_009646 [Dissostichus mawsoni]|uniref:Uncharacterized protein n=1 Tax=Dissostichus mawsoni TaxID=36200 RepID=A0A7J5XP82_DISMA|nr:hypothetical protein F7725_009646 [Dissostichus mawsoni]